VSNEFSRFRSGGGGESPARSTLSLIFNVLNSSFGNPIDGSEVFFSFFWEFFVFSSGIRCHEVNSFEFCFGKIGELVFTLSISDSGSSIVFFNGFHVGVIDLES